MKTYGEYCPIAMGAELVGDRWTPLVLREMFVGSTRFSDIHRGIPRISRSLLAQRLRQLGQVGLVAHEPDGSYVLTDAGLDLRPVVFALGEWSLKWFFGDPQKEHLDGAHLMWRMRQGLALDALPAERVVVRFDFLRAERGRRAWLVLEPSAPSVCERDEGFEVDLFVTADIVELHRVWMGRSSWREAIAAGHLTLEGPRSLVRAFPTWFQLSPFVAR